MTDLLLVTICIPTYQHESFIAQTLEGCLSQQTDFDFEIIVGDDASSDQTPKIIKEYADRFPKIIKPFLHQTNLGPVFPKELGGKNNVKFLFERCKTKYIALCEGDDYWIEPLKLQKQIDFLEQNEDYNLSHHQTQIIYQNSFKTDFFNDQFRKQTNEIDEMLADHWVIATTSAVFRNVFQNGMAIWFEEAASGDWAIFFQVIQEKKIHYLSQTMGVYRKHLGGMTNIHIEKNRFFLKNRLEMFRSIKPFYSFARQEIIEKTINEYGKKLKILSNSHID